MMGPVLLRVEVEDAKQNVGKRLELIKGSMYVEGGREGREERGQKGKWQSSNIYLSFSPLSSSIK